MADAVAWTSLVISVIVATYTGWFQFLVYQREHIPRLAVSARGVTDIRAAHDDEWEGANLGGAVMEPALEITVVNTGARAVEIAEVHTIREGDDSGYWLRDAQGRLNLRIEPGASKRWLEPMTTHFRKLEIREPDEIGLRLRAQVTIANGRKFSSDYVDLWLKSPEIRRGKIQRIKRKKREE